MDGIFVLFQVHFSDLIFFSYTKRIQIIPRWKEYIIVITMFRLLFVTIFAFNTLKLVMNKLSIRMNVTYLSIVQTLFNTLDLLSTCRAPIRTNAQYESVVTIKVIELYDFGHNAGCWMTLDTIIFLTTFQSCMAL